MKKIILLTSGYPFSKKGEEFIEPEMHFLAEENYDVQICAITQNLPNSINQYKPKNVDAEIMFTTNFSPFEKIKCCFRALSRKQVRREFFELVFRKKFKYIRTMIAFCSRGERIYLSLEKRIKKGQEIILYSYWLVDSAYAIAMLKQKYGYKAVSRVHGGDLYEERNNGYLPMRKYLFDTLDAIYSVSEKGRNYLVEKYGYPNKIQTVYLGTLRPNITYEFKKHSQFHIVSCSYLLPLKRVPMIAEALSSINDKNIVWTHFGDGQDKEEIFKIASRFSKNIVFDFKGNTIHNDILDYYKNNQIDLFINVSTTEGIPVSIMEAISYGIPVIATDVGGSGEIVNNNNGFLVSPNITTTELGKIIRDYFSLDEKKIAEYRANSFNYWCQKFNAVKNYCEFYSSL